MHIPDGFCSLPVSMTTAAVSLGALGLSIAKIRQGQSKAKGSSLLPATAAGVVFSAQMLNFPVAAGTSGHFLGALAMAALFGPCRAFLIMLSVLAVQAFAFADGGIIALGANLFNMGVIGGFVGYGVLRGLMLFLPKNRMGFLGAVGIASWASVILASIACSIELALSGSVPLAAGLPAMVGTHALIGIGEGLISCAIVGAVAYSRPDLLPDWTGFSKLAPSSHRPSRIWPIALIGVGLSFLLAAFLSPFASSSPDGLERVAEDMGFIDRIKELWTSSPLPDYSLTSITDPAISTGVAGVIGAVIVIAVCYLLYRLFTAGAPRASL